MMLEGYDNVAQKFVATTINNDTGIISLEGRYDPSTQTITYDGASTSHVHPDLAPGTKIQFRGVVKLIDRDHYQLGWHESIDGKELVDAVLDYTRVSAK
jgi:hypothetical protein